MSILTNPHPESHLVNTMSIQEKISSNHEISNIVETSELVRQVSHLIKRKTNLGVQEINVFLENGKLILTGFCRSFYTKQLAQEAVLKMIDDIDLVNQINVA
jgi:osmotically-inducible protein OsmY